MALINFYKGLESAYDSSLHNNSIYQCTDSGVVYILGTKHEKISKEEIDNIVGSNTYTDANYISKETNLTDAALQLDEEIKATNDNLALMEANLEGNYLPLSGGTLSGDLKIEYSKVLNFYGSGTSGSGSSVKMYATVTPKGEERFWIDTDGYIQIYGSVSHAGAGQNYGISLDPMADLKFGDLNADVPDVSINTLGLHFKDKTITDLVTAAGGTTTIKTINNESLLGDGNINLVTSTDLSNYLTTGNVTIADINNLGNNWSSVLANNVQSKNFTVNGAVKSVYGPSTETFSIYAPSDAGDSGQFLKSTGSVPSWNNIEISDITNLQSTLDNKVSLTGDSFKNNNVCWGGKTTNGDNVCLAFVDPNNNNKFGSWTGGTYIRSNSPQNLMLEVGTVGESSSTFYDIYNEGNFKAGVDYVAPSTLNNYALKEDNITISVIASDTANSQNAKGYSRIFNNNFNVAFYDGTYNYIPNSFMTNGEEAIITYSVFNNKGYTIYKCTLTSTGICTKEILHQFTIPTIQTVSEFPTDLDNYADGSIFIKE